MGLTSERWRVRSTTSRSIDCRVTVCLGINPDRSNPAIELEFPSYQYQIATLSPWNGLEMKPQTRTELLLHSCAFQDEVRPNMIRTLSLSELVGRRQRQSDPVGFLRLVTIERIRVDRAKSSRTLGTAVRRVVVSLIDERPFV